MLGTFCLLRYSDIPSGTRFETLLGAANSCLIIIIINEEIV